MSARGSICTRRSCCGDARRAAARNAQWIALAGAISFVILAHRERDSLAALRPYGGYANWLTALRLYLVLVAAASIGTVTHAGCVAVLAANVALDVVDGYVARRTGEATTLGTVFDRETDGVFVLVAYSYLFLSADVPAGSCCRAYYPMDIACSL